MRRKTIRKHRKHHPPKRKTVKKQKKQDQSFIVCAFLPAPETAAIIDTRAYLHEKYGGHLKYPTTGRPHITIAYGKGDLPNTTSTINAAFPGFRALGNRVHHPSVTVKGVSEFKHPTSGARIIKIEVTSPGLNRLRNHLRKTNPSMDKTATAFERHDSLSPWAHSTLLVLKESVDDATVTTILEDAIEHLGANFVGKTFHVDSIGVTSAKADAPIILW